MELITPPAPNLFDRFNRWIQESIMVKLFSIGFLILVLMMPSVWIQDLITERKQRASAVVDEVAAKWSGRQIVSGPILVIPYRKQEVIDKGNSEKEIREHIERAFFLPEKLDITGTVNPETLHRGIFDAVVYSSKLQVNSYFSKPDFASLNITDELINWKDAYLIFGVTDLRGISDNPLITVGGANVSAEPSNNIGVDIYKVVRPVADEYNSERVINQTATSSVEESSKGIVAKLGWASAESFRSAVDVALNIKGSESLNFVPTGKTTTVNLSGPWSSPSFDGEFLPDPREVTDDGFKATWKVLHFNRPFSQQWTENNQQLGGSDFGLRLIVPVDQYQKTMRTAKYGVLVILLTFVALFLVEITQKIRIHPFQYILIGAALIIYYCLLLSFAEQVGYNIAYAIASIATIVLVSLYSRSFMDKRLTLLFTFLLTIFYTFVLVIILQQDFSLLLGSVGLFIIVGFLMYFSRKVNWYRESISNGVN
jgi:inner membrane protein